MSEEQLVLTERRGRVLLITLNRPDARNAVNGPVAQAIEAAVDELENDDDLWCGVLAGNGKAFCAGADLKWIAQGKVAALSTERGGFAGITRRERTKPIIAAVHSHAFAGGFEIAIACDLIIAGETVKFGLPEAKRSLVALAGGLVVLPRLIGEKLALEMAITGDAYPAQRMYDAGLVSRIVPNDEVVDAAIGMAEAIAKCGPLAVKASRQIVLAARDMKPAEHWAMADKVGWPVFLSEDAKEGPRAFIEKREPVWQGK